MGLLDFDMNDPKTAGLLNIGLGILMGNTGRPGDLGQGVLQGVGNYQNMMAQQQRQKLLEQQQQMQNTQFEWTKADREREQAQRDKQQELMGRLPQTLGINPDVLAAYPQIGQKLLEQQYMPQEIKAYKPGDVLYQGGKQVGAIPSAEDLNPNKPFMVIDGQIVPNKAYQDYELEKASRSAAKTTLNVNQTQEKEENKAVGKYFGEQYADIQKSGLSASGKINRVQRLNQLLENVNTGKFTPLGVEVASAAQSLGFSIDPKLGNKQAAEALSNEMALEMRNPSGGAGMPGALSDKDREFLKQMVPGIEKTPEGRRMISESMVKLAKREQEVAKMARQYRKKNGTIDEGFYEELQAYSEKNPLFSSSTVPVPAASGGWSIRKVK
jgi:hypothetical protein